ncbi:MAG TPA: methyl-accepting chemotaxis protein [Patescibacteria group bacterium]|nr:methyl-accepting chemotaxis protein [Patescibacteria group bacterium]
MNMKIKLRTKLLLYISVPVMIVLIGLSLFAYFQARAALETQIRESTVNLTAYHAAEIDKVLRQRQAVIDTLAIELSRQIPADDELRRLMEYMTKNVPGAGDIYVGFKDKHFIDGTGWLPPADYDPTSRGWYKQAVDSQTAVYTDAYMDVITKKPVVSIARAIRVNGQIVGVVGMDLDLKEVTEMAQKVKTGETGYGFLLSREGQYIYHPTLKVLEDNILKLQNGAFAEVGKNILSGKPMFQETFFGGSEKLMASAPVGVSGWALVVTVPKNELFRATALLGQVSAGISLVAALLLFLLIFYIARSITRPLTVITANLQELAAGDLRHTIDPGLVERTDEFGVMAGAYATMSHNMQEAIRRVMNSAEHLAASAEELTAGAGQSADTAQNVAQSVNEIASGSEQQVHSIHETSSSIQQISQKVRDMTGKSETVSRLTEEAVTASQSGHSALERASRQMNQISDSSQSVAISVEQLSASSQKIQEIVSLITGIAGQTNLLALNAAIEAARAGEQGRGFAVVAEEVRKLAEQSEAAARQISELIHSNVQNIQEAVTAMANGTANVEAGNRVMQEVDEAFRAIESSVGQVTRESQSMSGAVLEAAALSDQVAVAAERMETVVKNSALQTELVSAATEEQTASAEEISAASHTLAKLAEELQQAVSKFRV